MTFVKPTDITYTDMCIYIDSNIYNESFDINKVYEYLYHIIFMLAKQAQLFSKHKYYDSFAIFGASRVYFRLTNKKQFETKPDGTPKMEKIKSVLNYIKNILYPLKVDFEQEEYAQTIVVTDSTELNQYTYNQLLTQAVDKLTFSDFGMTLNDITKTCEQFLSTVPYSRDSSMWYNIYASVLLTFLSYVTLSNKHHRRIEHLESTTRLKDKHIDDFFTAARKSEPILFHLPKSIGPYITVLARQLQTIVAKDLSDILHTPVNNDFQLIEMINNENKN